MLAMRIAFMNELAAVSEKVGADITEVSRSIGRDFRIGPHFLNPGPGFGGSCFGKDLKAFSFVASSLGITSYLSEATLESNDVSRLRPIQSMINAIPGTDTDQINIAILGLSFKPDTDDVRDSPALFIVPNLVKMGYKVSCHDFIAAENFKKSCSNTNYSISSDLGEALFGADVVIHLTECHEYNTISSKSLLDMTGKEKVVLIDTRRTMSKSQGNGVIYKAFGIGT